ncbi:MAG: hypothetical protein WCC36_06550, partial [Gammaproteobacteria bacterium]
PLLRRHRGRSQKLTIFSASATSALCSVWLPTSMGQSAKQAVDVPSDAIVYAQTPESTIAYFTRLTAGLGVHVRVFPRGWRDWADHTAMPVDAETLPSFASSTPAPRNAPQNGPPASASLFAVSITSLLFAIAAVAIAMRRKEWI